MSLASYIKKVQVATATPEQIAAFKADALGVVSTIAGVSWESLPTEAPTLNFAGDLVDDTTLRNVGFRTRLQTIFDWSINCDSNFDSGDAGLTILSTAMLARQPVFVRYLPNAGIEGTADADINLTSGLVGLALIENFNMSGAVAGKEEVGITLQGNGKLSPTA